MVETVLITLFRIPPNSVTLNEFKKLGPKQHQKIPRAKTSAINPDINRTSRHHRSYSDDEVSNFIIHGRTKVVKDEHQKNRFDDGLIKPFLKHHGGRGDTAIKAPFTTLEEILKDVPINVGFNVEVKYPDTKEAEDNHLDYPELNLYVDRILQTVYDHAGI